MASTEITRARSFGGLRTDLGTGLAANGAEQSRRSLVVTRTTAWRHWLFPLTVAVFLTLLVEGTYVLSERNAAGLAIFAGQSWAPHDVAQYVAAIEDGRAGAVLIRDRLTPEPHQPALIYGFYVALGWVARTTGLETPTIYRLAGVLSRVFVLLAIYAATALVSPAPWRRRIAFSLAAVGGGIVPLLGLLQALVMHVTGPFALPVSGRDLEEPEFGTFVLLFGSPHLMIGLALLLLAVLAYVRSWRSPGWLAPIAAAVMTLAVGLINSFSLGTLCVVVGLHAVVMTVLTRRLIWHGLIAAALVIVAAVPLLAYSLLAFVMGGDPVWSITYGRQNQTLTPNVANVLVSFGLILVLAVVGARTMVRHLTVGRALVLTWIAAAFVLMYLPLGVQRRFAFGLQPMLAMAAAFGLPPLWHVVRAQRRAPWSLARPLGTVLLIHALAGSTLLLLGVAVGQAVSVGEYRADDGRSDFFPAALEPAGRWLAQHAGADDVVLADSATGNYLVGMMPGRVFVGHWVATVNYEARRRQVAWLFGGPVDDERRSFLQAERVRFVVVGPTERRRLAWDLSAPLDGLSPVYSSADVTIFEVAPR